jgi:sterol desaturase/sphingolipid hydroxylase (fatty acid hydroxylase superfamily)
VALTEARVPWEAATDTAVSRGRPPGPVSERPRLVPTVLTLALLAVGVAVRSRLLFGFVVLVAIFVPMEKLFSLHPRRVFRRGWATDLVHFFVTNLLITVGFLVAAAVFATLLRFALGDGLGRIVHAQPQSAQVAAGLLLAELLFYWAHRTSHHLGLLWRFHAIHHSITEMDWLAAARQHPLDAVFHRVFVAIPLFLLGFTRLTVGAVVLFAALNALFIHSNVRLRFGPLRWVITTPEFHHWHHANEPEAVNRNFAGGLPVLDVLFGTAYLPKGRVPAAYGIDEPVPGEYLHQLTHPFRRA